MKGQGIEEQYLAAINVETKAAERFVLHNDSALVYDVVAVIPVKKKSEMYTSVALFTKDITSNQALGILVLLPDGSGQFFEYASSFGNNGKILPNVAKRLSGLLGRPSN